ncbi:MAG: AEC family transporter [Rhodocyclaceae bacterium]|nr:AEC family transporter [Rhodocyclaceae bacterium]MBX3669176.1 AEC family transporter [Rhodocyclaceae bacterium]
MFDILAPIFGLVFLGYLSRRYKLVGPTAFSELNRFVACLALPALLFDIVAHVRLEQLGQAGFLASFGIGAFAMFALPFVVLRRGRPFGDTVLDGLCAGYPNTGFIGLPLAQLAFGPSSAPGAAIAAVFTTCIIFGFAIALLEWDSQRGSSLRSTAVKVFNSLIRNPMVIVPLSAVVVSAGWVTLPPSVERLLKLLGGAAGPCALVAIGLFFARDDPNDDKAWSAFFQPRTLALVVVKLVLQPLLTVVLAMFVFKLDSRDTILVTVMSALPTGSGSFMLATYYKRDPVLTSAVILVSTVAAPLTLSILLVTLPMLH